MEKQWRCYVFVFDSGRDVFTDLTDFEKRTDISMATHLTGPMLSSMAGYLEMMNEQWRVVRCNSSIFVFTQREDMHFFAMSNQGEDDLQLCRQIQHMQDQFLQLYGPSIFDSSQRHLNNQSQKKRIQKLFLSLKQRFFTDQTYLFMTLRSFPLRTTALRECITQHNIFVKNRIVKYVLIFWDTQLLFSSPRPKTEPLSTRNTLNLIGMVLAHYSTVETVVDHSHIIPLESLHEEVSRKSLRYLQKYTLAHNKRKSASSSLPNDSPFIPPLKKKAFSIQEEDDEELDGNLPFALDESTGDIQPLTPLYVTNHEEIQVNPGAEASEEEEEEEEEFQIFSPLEETFVISSSIATGNAPQRETTDSHQNLLRTKIYIQDGEYACPFVVHAYPMSGTKLHLVIVNEPTEELDDLYQQKIKTQEEHRASDEIFAIFTGAIGHNMVDLFQKSVENQWQHFLKQQMQEFPGLVHFLLVRRSDDTLYAPNITSLHGSQYQNVEKKKAMTSYLRNAVRDLVAHGHNCLFNGHHTMVLSGDRFTYFYHVWDDNSPDHSSFLQAGPTLKVKPTPTHARSSTLLDSSWFQNNITNLRSPSGGTSNYYEFFGLFLREMPQKHLFAATRSIVDAFFKVLDAGEG